MDIKENGGLTPGGFNIDLEQIAREIIEKYPDAFEKVPSKKNKSSSSNENKNQASRKICNKEVNNKY